MINGNVIKFGYGDVAVGHCNYTIKFQQFIPKQKPGTNVDADSVVWVGEKIEIPISVSDYYFLMKELDKCVHKRAFSFKEYIFDFNNFNLNSVKVVRESVEKSMFLHFLSLAA